MAFLTLGWLLAQIVSILLCQYVFDIDITSYNFIDFTRIDVIRLNKILNLVSHIFMFLLPAVIFVKLVSFEPYEFVLNKKPSKKIWFVLPVVFVGLTVLNELLFNLNHSINFTFISKEFQESLEYKQAIKSKAIYSYVGTTWKSFFANMFLLALVPAIGEELTFRGVLQHLTGKFFGNVNAGVIVSAFIFAFIHFQPFNFLPIFTLGLLYGFIVMYSGSIWISIILHFANNALSVILMHSGRYYNWDFQTTIWTDLILVSISLVVILLFVKKYPQASKWNETKGIYLR